MSQFIERQDAQVLDASEIRRPLTDIQKERMLAILLRRPDAFSRAIQQLSPEQFPPQDRVYSIPWAVAVEHWRQFAALPNRDEMITECQSRLRQSPGTITPAELKRLQTFVHRAFAADESNLKVEVGLDYLRRYLEELLFETCRMQMTGVQPRDAFRFLETYADRAATLSILTDPGIGNPFSDDWDTQGRVVTPLGIKPIDHFTGGGYAGGEVYVILGPVGSCKTLTAVQSSINIATTNRANWIKRQKQGPLGLSYLFYYEGGEDEIRQRAVVYSGRISREIVGSGNLRQKLRRDGEPLRPYEQAEFAAALASGGTVESEQARFYNAMRELNVNWRAIAMKPTPASPGRGGGSYEEILQLIEADLAKLRNQGSDVYCAGVVVDYLGIMIERHIQARRIDRDKSYRPLLVRAPLFFKQAVAEHFNCPVFLMHQLNAKGNSLSPSQLPKLTDSEGSNMLVENADFGIVIGKPQVDYVCLMGCGKARHTRILDPVVFQIHGDLGYIGFPSEMRVADPASGKLVGADQMHTVSNRPSALGKGRMSSADKIAAANQAVLDD